MDKTRTLQQVTSMLNLAKYLESDVKNESFVLQFKSQILDSKDVKLLEVSKETLEYINCGERFGFIISHPHLF